MNGNSGRTFLEQRCFGATFAISINMQRLKFSGESHDQSHGLKIIVKIQTASGQLKVQAFTCTIAPKINSSSFMNGNLVHLNSHV